MADKLSLPNLLSLLQVDQQSDIIIRELRDNSERLRRRHRYEDAMKTAQDAVLLVRNEYRFNYNLHGVTLLYLSAARLSYNSPHHNRKAICDCEEAITYLRFEPHNSAIAEIIRAQIELQAYSDNPKSKQHALAHLQRAAQTLLEQQRTEWRVSNKLKQDESELLSAVTAKISELVALQSDILPTTVTTKQPGRPATLTEQAIRTAPIVPIPLGSSTPPIDLPIPTQLVWPVPGAFGFGLSSVYGGSASDQNHDQVQSCPPLDFIEVSRFSINGKPYAVHPIGSAPNDDGTLRLRHSQQYTIIQINGDRASHSDQYVLVRQQDRPDQSGQKIVIADLPHKRVWVWITEDDSKSIPSKIIGGSDDVQNGNLRERQWKMNDGSETVHYSNAEIRIIGVVEAILTPIVQSIPLSASATTTLPE